MCAWVLGKLSYFRKGLAEGAKKRSGTDTVPGTKAVSISTAVASVHR